jgi:hypothetical protein
MIDKPLPTPTDALPGSAEKIAVLAERLALGQQLHHPADAGGRRRGPKFLRGRGYCVSFSWWRGRWRVWVPCYEGARRRIIFGGEFFEKPAAIAAAKRLREQLDAATLTVPTVTRPD